MEKCEHFTIRGAVAEFRKKDWRLNYPFPIPQEQPEWMNFLLPPLDIFRSKRWNCDGCVEDFIEGDHPEQLNGAGPSVLRVPNSDVELVTIKENSPVDKVNVFTSYAKDANALQPLNCRDVGSVGVEGILIEENQTHFEDPKTNAICYTTDSDLLTEQNPKVTFDLNEPPTPETSEPALEMDALATEEHMSDSRDCDDVDASPATEGLAVNAAAALVATDASPLTEGLSVNSAAAPVATDAFPATEEFAVNSVAAPVATDASPATEELKEDSEASPVATDAGTSNRNGCPSPEMETVDSFESADDDDLIPMGDEGALRRRKTPKYRTLADLLKEGKEEKSQDVQPDGTTEIAPTPGPRPKKMKLKKTKKRQETRIQEKDGPELSEASTDAPREDAKNRAFNFNQPLEQNNILLLVLDDGNLQLPLVPSGKRKQRHFANRKDNSDINVSEPTEMGAAAPPIENENILLPKKRRIFGDEVHGDGEAETSRREKSGSMIVKHASKKKQSQNPVAECGKVLTTQSKKTAGKGADERIFGAQKQKKNHCDVSGCVSGLRSIDEIPTLVGKELVLGDRPILTRAQDDAPKNEMLIQKGKQICKEALKTAMDMDELCLQKLDTSKIKMINHPANRKSVEHGSKEKQNFKLVDDGTVPPTKTQKCVGIDDDQRIFGAKNTKKSGSDVSGRPYKQKSPDLAYHKSAGKDTKQHLSGPEAKQKRKKKNHGDVSGSACGESSDEGRPTKVRKALTLEDSRIVSPQFTREQKTLTGMHLLSMAAAETEDAIRPFGAIREEVLVHLATVVPLSSNILALGYSGCAQATSPNEDFLIDEAEVELLTLGPEDLPLRSHRIIKPIAAKPKRTVVKCVDSGRQLLWKEKNQYQRTNAVRLCSGIDS